MDCNGWEIYFHKLFQEALSELVKKVVDEKKKDPSTYKQKDITKLLAKVISLIKQEIPGNPFHPKYFLGSTLEKPYRDWRRAKPAQQYRLFFKFSGEKKTIIYAWLNDLQTLRKYNSKTDAYKTFASHLNTAKIANNYVELKKESTSYESGEIASVVE